MPGDLRKDSQKRHNMKQKGSPRFGVLDHWPLSIREGSASHKLLPLQDLNTDAPLRPQSLQSSVPRGKFLSYRWHENMRHKHGVGKRRLQRAVGRKREWDPGNPRLHSQSFWVTLVKSLNSCIHLGNIRMIPVSSSSTVEEKSKGSHTCNLKFSSCGYRKVKRRGDMNFNVFYLTQYVQNITIV